MINVAILISGGGSNMVSLLDMLDGTDQAHARLVLSNRAAAGGLAKAAARGVDTHVLDHKPYGDDRAAFEGALHSVLLDANIDLVCLAGFMRILTPEFVGKWAGKMLNIHPSLLPKYKGLHTHKRALEAGDAEHGCSVHLVTGELDGGPVLGQARVPVLAGDNADDLAARVLVEEHKLYPQVLARFLQGDTSTLYL